MLRKPAFDIFFLLFFHFLITSFCYFSFAPLDKIHAHEDGDILQALVTIFMMAAPSVSILAHATIWLSFYQEQEQQVENNTCTYCSI